VTTTPNLEGMEIHEYLGPVFSHVVAGTGFFSDFAASFTDVFGGRSQSYQKQLTAINSEAIELLKREAALLGGNFILGLRIDQDEISGKAKQMFMVTASGTAVRVSQKPSSSHAEQSLQFLPVSALDLALKKSAVIEKAKVLPLKLTEEEWMFVTDNKVDEIAPQVLRDVQAIRKFSNVLPQEAWDRRTAYFLNLPSAYSIPVLYRGLIENDLVFDFVRQIIFKGDLFDFEMILALLRSDDFAIKKWALDLARGDKPVYVPEDIGRFGELIETIKSTFAVRAKFVEDKSRFTASIKQKWCCECGEKNEREASICLKCGRDIYGFYENNHKPDAVQRLLEAKVSVLRTFFK
jgi:uncharacterized protein YbjQ (UPF0145 family)